MADADVQAFFAGTRTTRGYLCGFNEPSIERLMLLGLHIDRPPVLFSPTISGEGAHRNPAGISDIRLWLDGSDPKVPLRPWFKNWKLDTAAIAVDDEMPAAFLLALQQTLPNARFTVGSPLMARVRARKDADELTLMRRASRLTDSALSAALEACRDGRTERGVALAIQHAIHEMDGEIAFDTIVGSGPHSALPHHHTGDRILTAGDVIILDYGAMSEGYNGDITRTVCLGEASEEVQEVYKIAWDAHHAARAAVKPGVTAASVDRAAREVIERAGYGQYFIHRTGHGIGLQVHEAPFIVEGNELALEEGMCFSIEPGIYLPGRFGVRIENIVRVTDAGHESLNAEPQEHIRELVL